MNKAGTEFRDTLREIVRYANEHIKPENRARFVAFEICMMLDDTGEFGDFGEGLRFKVVTTDNEPVECRHDDF